MLGQEAMIQEFIEGSFRKVFASYGYLPQYTPALENFDLLAAKSAAGEAIKEEIYYFKDKGGRELGLRFDLTVPLGRVAATNQLKMPYKRYAIEEVYRYDRPQAKRYRAFKQADVDVLGVEGLEAELEVMLVTRDCFSALGLKPRVVFNSRKLLDDLLKQYGKGREIEAMRILDKIDKIGKEEVKKALKEKGIDEEIVSVIERNNLEEITQIVGQASDGLKEIIEFTELCNEIKLDFVEFSASLARGLEYYTGIVFEVKLEEGPSVGGGGRYDKLIGNYGGKDTFAVGISFGVSRILDILQEKGFKTGMEGIFLLGINIEKKELFKISEVFRKEEIYNEIDLAGKNISKGIEYAEKKGYGFVGLIGENELKKEEITIKNLKEGKQELFKTKDIKKVKSFLEK